MDNKELTIFIPLSREWRIDGIKDQLNELDTTGFNVTLLIICDDLEILKDRIEFVFSHFKVKIFYTDNKPQPEIARNARRQRIADIFNFAKRFIHSQYLLVIEDDTNFKSDFIQRLYQDYSDISLIYNVGFVSGIQAGRWGVKMLGVWNVDNVEDIKAIETLMPKEDGLEQITATGFYGFFCESKTFKSVEFKNGFAICGPDVAFGIELSRKGFKNYVDWSLKLGHDVRNIVIYPDSDCTKIGFELINDNWDIQKHGKSI